MERKKKKVIEGKKKGMGVGERGRGYKFLRMREKYLKNIIVFRK